MKISVNNIYYRIEVKRAQRYSLDRNKHRDEQQISVATSETYQSTFIEKVNKVNNILMKDYFGL